MIEIYIYVLANQISLYNSVVLKPAFHYIPFSLVLYNAITTLAPVVSEHLIFLENKNNKYFSRNRKINFLEELLDKRWVSIKEKKYWKNHS